MKERLEKIYKCLGLITVAGDSVDYLAAARSELRSLYEEMDKPDAEHDTKKVG